MKKRVWFALWGGLFSLCAGLGFIPAPAGALRTGLTVLSVLCFLPPAVLLFRAEKKNDRHTAALIRNLAALSLGLTLVLLIGNVLSVRGSALVGEILHALLVIISSPMICSGYWALSLFLWACLLIMSLNILGKI